MKMFLAEFLAAICAAFFLNAYFNDDKPAEPPPQKVVVQVEQPTVTPVKPANVNMTPAPPAAVEPQNYFANGQFKVGVDLPAGEYLAVGTGYVEVAGSSAGGTNNILINDNIVDARRYVVVNDGEYVKVMSDMKLYSLADAPKLNLNYSKLPANQYKVGVDIPAGEYKILLDAGGYVALTRDTRRNYVGNQYAHNGGQFYATVADGQYLQIKNGTGEFVAAAK